ncbi:hypothetical protein KY285_023804 [Solanum tuberosum]|nr:hypothetical protein KY289_024137 [Solanum tuberosum]KAH0676003.1 hypothetical protein KY285_023804 [Solanum tuberosum]
MQPNLLPPTSSQSKGHNDSESSISEVKINVKPEDNPPRDTRSRTTRAILQDTLPQSKERGSRFGSGEESGSESNAGSGCQSDGGLGGSAESETGSQEEATTPPPTVHIAAETGAQEEAGTRGANEKITIDDTIVLYVNIHELDSAARQQVIDCFQSMWIVHRCEDFFNNQIVNKSGGFKNRPIMPETTVVVDDIKAFPDIYRTFQFHQFDWMNNALENIPATWP